MDVNLKPNTIKTLKAGREAVEKYEADYCPLDDKAKVALNATLSSLGFKDLDEFSAWNVAMIVVAIQECRIDARGGACDKCEGLPESECPCVILWGERGAGGRASALSSARYARNLEKRGAMPGASQKRSSTNEELIEKAAIQSFITGDATKCYYLCPVGRGYYYDVTKLKPFPFDVQWVHPPGIHISPENMAKYGIK